MEKALCEIAPVKIARVNFQGFVLVVVLLFLSIFNLLVIASLNTNLLMSKGKSFYLDKIRSFYLAETRLIDLEERVLSKDYVVEQENIKMVEQNSCGDLYRIRAMAKYRDSVSMLESTVLKLDKVNNCKIGTFRQSFLIIK